MKSAVQRVDDKEQQTTETPPSDTAAHKEAAVQVLDTEYKEKEMPMATIIKDIVSQYDRSSFDVLTEIVKLSFSEGKIGPDEYVEQRLFDSATLKSSIKDFVGAIGSKVVANTINYDRRFDAIITDKVLFYATFTGLGLSTIHTKGFYTTGQSLPGMNSISTQDELRAFLMDKANYPFFGKPSYSSQSLGVVGGQELDAATGTITLINGATTTVDELVDIIIEHYGDGFLLQELLEPNQGWAGTVGERIGTARLYTLNVGQSPELFRAVIKLPVRANMADNFWRSGNLLSELDHETGEILRVVRGTGMNQVEMETHPDTGARLIGAKVPQWDEMVALAFNAHKVIRDMPLIGWDMAATSRGPVLVEANRAPDLRMPQLVTRRGSLDSHLRQVLQQRRDEQKALSSKKNAGRGAYIKSKLNRYKMQ